jgi:hypothetical protein
VRKIRSGRVGETSFSDDLLVNQNQSRGVNGLAPEFCQSTTRAAVELRAGANWLDGLNDWALPPQSAQAAGDSDPVRVFDTAEAALAFLMGPRVAECDDLRWVSARYAREAVTRPI